MQHFQAEMQAPYTAQCHIPTTVIHENKHNAHPILQILCM